MNPNNYGQRHSRSTNGRIVLVLLLLKIPLMAGLFLFISADSGKNLSTTLTILAINSALIYALYRLTILSRYLNRHLALAKAQAKAQREIMEIANQKIRAVTKIKHEYNLARSDTEEDLKNHEFAIKHSRDKKLERKQAITDQLTRLRTEFSNELLRIGIDAKGIFSKAIGHCIAAEAQANRIKPRYCNKHSNPTQMSSLTQQTESQFGQTVDQLISEINPIKTHSKTHSQP